MAALTLSDMLTRVKRIVPTNQLDTALQDSLLERMNYLVSLDTFPFQEMYEYATLTQGTYQLAAPSNFAVAKSMVVWSPNGSEARRLDSTLPSSSSASLNWPVTRQRAEQSLRVLGPAHGIAQGWLLGPTIRYTSQLQSLAA